MDPDIRDYIAECLIENTDANETIEYVNILSVESFPNRSLEVLTGVSYSVSAFKSGNVIHIFPTYEFTTPKRPRGNDAFTYQLADAFQSYEYGGKLWYKLYENSSWVADDNLVANQQGLNYACYSGTQLGTPDFSLYLKGCTYCKSYTGNGTDKRIVLSYLYNPSNTSWSLGVSYYGVGISYNPAGTAYSSAQTFFVSY